MTPRTSSAKPNWQFQIMRPGTPTDMCSRETRGGPISIAVPISRSRFATRQSARSVDMARSVTISGGWTSNFSGDGSVAAGEGRKIHFMENKNCSFQGHACRLFRQPATPSFSSSQVSCRVPLFVKSFHLCFGLGAGVHEHEFAA